MMKQWNVYERRGTGRSYIGRVTAHDHSAAVVKAHSTYGAPIIVEEA